MAPMAPDIIQNTTELTCKGLTCSKDKICFANPGIMYWKLPINPKVIPNTSNMRPSKMNLDATAFYSCSILPLVFILNVLGSELPDESSNFKNCMRECNSWSVKSN